MFDRFVMVDWSAASTPVTGRDSIWLGIADTQGATVVENIATRAAAVARLKEICLKALEADQRLLIGFDFPFGYPAGVARHVTGKDSALGLARWISARMSDGPKNANNRFEIAAEINRMYPGVGPFWGRPASVDQPDIPIKASARSGPDHPNERRLADQTAKGAKTVWQLAYAGSVGSQVLTGLPALLALRDDPDIGEQIRFWPFETGLEAGTTPITLAEIYPSLLPPDPSEPIKDAGQVRAVADWLKGLTSEDMARLFHGPEGMSQQDRQTIEREEAWILGLEQTPIVKTPPSPPDRLRYERAPDQIYRQSFSIVADEANLDHLPDDLHKTAVRLVHACGMPEITARLAWSADLVDNACAALAAGAPILCDCEAVASMVIRRNLPAGNEVICTLNNPGVLERAKRIGNTRSAAAAELWADHLEGAIVAIGNAPTALYRLLEMLDAGAPRPAAILGFPVGFVGAAESKAALATDPRGAPFLTLRGRRGGSAMAAAAVNALALQAGAQA